MKLFPMTLALAALALGGCAADRTDDQAEAQRLMQTSRDWSKAAATGDMDRVLAFFADDAVLISDGRPPVRGREALRAYLAESAGIPGFRISWEPLEARVSGDMGYMIERTRVTMDGPSGQPVTQELQAVTVWRKQPDGTCGWRSGSPGRPSCATSR